jgi:hypothetical protein
MTPIVENIHIHTYKINILFNIIYYKRKDIIAVAVKLCRKHFFSPFLIFQMLPAFWKAVDSGHFSSAGSMFRCTRDGWNFLVGSFYTSLFII